ncbi:CRAL-TRIO domain-containing protein C3H8.02 [Exophiala dermatitidis]
MRLCTCQHIVARSLLSLATRRVSPVFLAKSSPSKSQVRFSSWPHRLQSRRWRNPRPDPPSRAPDLEASSSSAYILVLAVACGGAIVLDYFTRKSSPVSVNSAAFDHRVLEKPLDHTRDPYYTNMPIPPGHLGNLTPEQEAKLREFWAATLAVFGVQDPHETNGTETPQTEDSQSLAEVDGKDKKKSKKRLGIFKRKGDKDSSNGTVTPTKDPSQHADSDDKYGQVKDFHHTLATQSPEALRAAFWSMVKADHPDALLLRFLRARKWDVDKALVMLVSTMKWRSQEQHVDDDIVFKGEGGALEDSKSSDPAVRSEGEDFLKQLRLGKSFLHGTDKEGRPLCHVRVRLHRGGEQSERSLERYTVYVIETARLTLRRPVETACIIFDMTDFSMANMDYTPVKFMIKVFEANYPESLGAVLVHKAPWIFQGIWKIIRGWLDPVVAGKVHFTSSVQDLEEFIDRSRIIKELEGDEDWEYHYVEPIPGENDAMKDEATRNALQAERDADVREYQKKTFEWIAKGTGADVDKIKEYRNTLAGRLYDNYWKLDKHIRARTYYDRTGMIGPDGKVNFYPPPPGKGENGSLPASSNVPEPETSADDVD